MREKLGISEDRLRTCLREEYGLSVVTLDFLPLGLDTRAGVYRAVSEQGTSYFLKAKSGAFYQPSCLVPDYLRKQGIAAVVAPIHTKSDTLWTQVGERGDGGEWTVIVYPFIDGDTGKKLGMTDENWREVGNIFKQIHQVTLPSGGFPSLRKETFDPTGYARWVRVFEAHELQQTGAFGGTEVERTLCSYWMTYQSAIHTMLTAMESLAGVLQERAGPYVICHADLHSNNMLIDQADHLFIIDWDDVMLALKERDFIFVREARAGDPALQAISPFFQGYGQTEIDWNALAYYLCERVITDLIESADEVFFRDDLGEESKADAARLFNDIFIRGDTASVALASLARLTTGPDNQHGPGNHKGLPLL